MLGYGDTIDRGEDPARMGDNLPFVDLGPGFFVDMVALGPFHSCALDTAQSVNEAVKCWGCLDYGDTNCHGALAFGDEPYEMGGNLSAISFVGAFSPVGVYVGFRTSCALSTDPHKLKCWGRGDYGILGQGDTDNSDEPVGIVLGNNFDVVAVSIGMYSMCAVSTNGECKVCVCMRSNISKFWRNVFHFCNWVQCWGGNANGNLGYEDSADRGDDTGEMGPDLDVVQLGAGFVVQSIDSIENQRCALATDGRIKVHMDMCTLHLLRSVFAQCWGSGTFGVHGINDKNIVGNAGNQMGDYLEAIAFNASSLALGGSDSNHHCALSTAVVNDVIITAHWSRILVCWGRNNYGQIGIGSTDNALLPELPQVQMDFYPTASPTPSQTPGPTPSPSPSPTLLVNNTSTSIPPTANTIPSTTAHPTAMLAVPSTSPPSAAPTVESPTPLPTPDLQPRPAPTAEPSQPTLHPSEQPTAGPSDAREAAEVGTSTTDMQETQSSDSLTSAPDTSLEVSSGDTDWLLIALPVVGMLCLATVLVVFLKWSRSKRKQKHQTEMNLSMAPGLARVPSKRVVRAYSETVASELPAMRLGPTLQIEGTVSQAQMPGLENKVTEGRDERVVTMELETVVTATTAGNDTQGKATREEVLEWLRDEVKLEVYFSNFLENGYESLALIKAIESKEELAEIGITKVGHQFFLLKHIRKMQEVQQEAQQEKPVLVHRETPYI